MPDFARDVHRVIPVEPYMSLQDYIDAGGGRGLEGARAVEPTVIIEEIAASGLRGRGGAGFPTGVKWRTVRSFASPVLPTSVVVNAAEGEPGTFKDRSILRANPYAVLEGALIAARAMEAASVTIATKAAFTDEVARLRAAIAEVAAAGWSDGIEWAIVEGPSEYLYGEETALLEVIDGRGPFPRLAPPYRRGIDEVVATEADVESGSGLSATRDLAANDGESVAPPVLVNNVETMANVPAIIARGASWFRSLGTEQSPGTIVCTVTGDVQYPGVVEVPMGTPLREVIEVAAGGAAPDQEIRAVLVGVSSAALTADQLDVPLSYEGMASLGSGLGSAGFIVIGSESHPVSVAAGVSRFLAVESCGQCSPCKADGAAASEILSRMTAGVADHPDLTELVSRLDTITKGARCSLATQHQTVVMSLMNAFRADFGNRARPGAEPIPMRLISSLIEVEPERELLDETFPQKQLDWTYDEIDSGKAPVERFTDHRAEPEYVEGGRE